MKTICALIIALLLVSNMSIAQDTMYMYKSGTLVDIRAVNNIDSIIFYRATELTSNKVTDIDGNIYNTITIGKQVWMTENLKSTRFNDNTVIPNISADNLWTALTTPAYCWYNNDEATYKPVYGALYNWYVVNTGKLCPIGWHVPTDAEWTALSTYLGDVSVAGGKLKETGFSHWKEPNTGATNEFGFTALPSGYRYYNGPFNSIGNYGGWWSSTDINANIAWGREVNANSSGILRSSNYGDDKRFAFSIRCIKN